jgi:hypothetical protein
MSEDKKHIIYHYCSLEAFHSIITTKSFRLFSLSSSNDRKELTEAKRILDNVLRQKKYKSINKFHSSKPDEFYSLSCTSKRDSALLFNKYADNDKGVCLGIDIEVFEKYLKNTSLMDLYLGYFFFPEVIYGDNQKKNEIEKYLDEKLRYIEQPEKVDAKELYELLVDGSSEQDKEILLRKFVYPTALSRFKPKLKIINYEDEAEARMLFCRSQFQLYKNHLKNPLNRAYNALIKRAENLKMNNPPKFIFKSGVKREYIELKMNAIWKKQPITEVILGPSCKIDIKEIKEFLDLNKVLCKVVNSKIKNRR